MLARVYAIDSGTASSGRRFGSTLELEYGS